MNKFSRFFIPKWNRFFSDVRCIIADWLFNLGNLITDASIHSRHKQWTWRKLK